MSTLTLQNPAWRLTLQPSLGGVISGLWLRPKAHADAPIASHAPAPEIELLRSMTAGAQDPLLSASYPLVPYSNRLAHCRFHWGGRDYTTQRNFGAHPHSLHGVGWQRAWQVVEHSDTSALLRLEHAPDADWPFAFRAEQRVLLLDDHVALRLSVTNTDRRVQPVGLGWHPHFRRRVGARIEAQVAARWDNDDTMLPQHRVPLEQLNGLVADMPLDHCFEGWSGEAHLSDAQLRCRISSSLGYLVVYTPQGADYFCVEPVSHRNDAIHSDDPSAHGLVALPPNETHAACLRLEAELLA